MILEKLFLDASLIEVHIKGADRAGVIRKLSRLLFAGGFVKETFEDAILAREEVFPTGLPFSVGVAIPHTDSEHVNQNAMAIGILENPVVFEEMGSRGKPVNISIVCMLAINDPTAIVKMLQRLMLTFQQPKVLEQLIAAPNSNTVVEILQGQIAEI